MGRYKEAPPGFQCPYRDACPHLNGRSTKWTNELLSDLEEDTYRDSQSAALLAEENAALRVDLERLEKEAAELRARLTAEHGSRFKPNRRRRAVDDPSPKKPRGAPKGHPAWNRPLPDRVDRVVSVPAPARCPHCATKGLRPTGEMHEQIQEDIVLQPKTVVTAYQHESAYCPNCRRAVFQTAEGELRHCQIGPTAKATAVFLRHELRLSYRQVRKTFAKLFGLNFVPASAMAFEQASARAAHPIHERLRDQVRCADIIHADETHWRIDGKAAFIWFAGNPKFGFFHIDPSRSGEVAKAIFGAPFPGSLVADDYAAYNLIEPRHRQSCLSHLSRKAKDIIQLIKLLPEGQQRPADLRFCQQVRDLITEACQIGRRREDGKLSFTQARAKVPELYASLHRIGKKACYHPEAKNLRQRMIDPKRDYHQLFTFLQINHMPPTNNYAEQTLRHPVIFRKLIFGNRSAFGAQCLAVNLSVLHTAKCLERDPISLIKTLLLSGAAAAAAILFENSS
jgi:transposase